MNSTYWTRTGSSRATSLERNGWLCVWECFGFSYYVDVMLWM